MSYAHNVYLEALSAERDVRDAFRRQEDNVRASRRDTIYRTAEEKELERLRKELDLAKDTTDRRRQEWYKAREQEAVTKEIQELKDRVQALEDIVSRAGLSNTQSHRV